MALLHSILESNPLERVAGGLTGGLLANPGLRQSQAQMLELIWLWSIHQPW